MGRTTLKMPQLGESVTEGTVDRWLKQEGDMVRRDEPIVEVVTDKVNAEIPSPFEGRLVRIEVQAGKPAPAPAAPRAAERGDELVRISVVRRQIAEHMVRSVSTSPHAWSLREVDVTKLQAYREASKDEFSQRHGFPLSYVPFFVQIVSDALLKNPYLNSTWTDDGIVLHHFVNMGIAVALPDALIVPVIKDADLMGFTDLAHAINDIANRARNKQLNAGDVRGG